MTWPDAKHIMNKTQNFKNPLFFFFANMLLTKEAGVLLAEAFQLYSKQSAQGQVFLQGF